MNEKSITAVILAAGLGSRLKERTQLRPKGFLEIEGLSLIKRSIQCLLQKGADRIIIGTGYLSQYFDDLRSEFPKVETCRNNDYAVTGSMYTLYTLHHLIKGPFLLLESDLLYEPAAIDYLLDDDTADVILASGPTHSGDEVFIQHSPAGLLENMSKNRNALKHIEGELTGITKLSYGTLQHMITYAQTAYASNERAMHYEDVLVGISAVCPIKVKVIQDLVWCEIDDESHLNRALQQVYPKIKVVNG